MHEKDTKTFKLGIKILTITICGSHKVLSQDRIALIALRESGEVTV